MTPTPHAGVLRLGSIAAGNPGLTWAGATALVEAAEVCFDHHGHGSGLTLEVRRESEATQAYAVVFSEPTPRAKRANSDLQDAVEAGAVAVATAWLMQATPYRVVERSRKGTGFDYWLGREAVVLDARLEVSGILDAKRHEPARRLRKKLGQMARSDALGLPGFAVVVEFETPVAFVGEKR